MMANMIIFEAFFSQEARLGWWGGGVKMEKHSENIS
jgi:hypothetical protein